MILIKKIFICLFIIEYLVVMNIYNGSILGIPENIEYSILYLIPLILTIKNKGERIEKVVLFIGFITQFYWYFINPWNLDNDRYLLSYKNNIKNRDTFFEDIKIVNRPRHRTEFYISHGLLAAMLFSVIINI